MLSKLRSASHISLNDWWLFARAWGWLLLFDLGLRVRPFPSLQAFASRPSSRPPLPPEQAGRQIRASITAVDRARHHHLHPMTCLRRALALQKMLSQRGIATELKIGVRKEDGQVSAHAWLEHQGTPLGEAEKITETFQVLQTSTNP